MSLESMLFDFMSGRITINELGEEDGERVSRTFDFEGKPVAGPEAPRPDTGGGMVERWWNDDKAFGFPFGDPVPGDGTVTADIPFSTHGDGGYEVEWSMGLVLPSGQIINVTELPRGGGEGFVLGSDLYPEGETCALRLFSSRSSNVYDIKFKGRGDQTYHIMRSGSGSNHSLRVREV